MSTPLILIPSAQYPTSICVVPTCGKPLGQDSKDEGWVVCKEHRLCTTCNAPLTPNEVRTIWTSAQADVASTGNAASLDLRHPRCAPFPNLASDPTLSVKQSYYDWLNNVRLMVEPQMDLSKSTNESNAQIYHARFIAQMTHDQIFAHIGMLEACIEQARHAIFKDRETLKKRADAREQIKHIKAKQEAETSTRPIGTPADEPSEVALSQFMLNFGFKSRKLALAAQRTRDKAVSSLLACNLPGITSIIAKAQADKALLDNISKGKVKLIEDGTN